MEISASFRNILEIGFGIIYMLGVGFNLAYTLRHGGEFYSGFAKGTWFSPAKWFITNFVIPNPRMFTTTLILFQLFVGIALLSQGPFVELGLLAGKPFACTWSSSPISPERLQIW